MNIEVRHTTVSSDAYSPPVSREADDRFLAASRQLVPAHTSELRHDLVVEVFEPANGPNVYEANELIVRHMPFGNSASTRNQRLQTRYMTEAEQTPVAAVSAPSTHRGNYRFRAAENVSPPFGGYLKEVGGALRSLNIPLGRLAFVGWSQGASLSLAHAAEAGAAHDITWVAAGDATNVVERLLRSSLPDFSTP